MVKSVYHGHMENIQLTVTGQDRANPDPIFYHAWLSADGVTVAYMHGIHRHGIVELWDIETREGYRNKGYATAIIEKVAEHYDVDEVIHGGGFTPDGFNFVQHLVTRPKNADFLDGAQYGNNVKFVHDWDRHVPENH